MRNRVCALKWLKIYFRLPLFENKISKTSLKLADRNAQYITSKEKGSLVPQNAYTITLQLRIYSACGRCSKLQFYL